MSKKSSRCQLKLPLCGALVYRTYALITGPWKQEGIKIKCKENKILKAKLNVQAV